MKGTFKKIVELAAREGPKTLILAPAGNPELCEVLSQAEKANLIRPVLIGKAARIKEMVRQTSLSRMEYEIIDESDDLASLTRALHMLRDGTGNILMQGNIDQSLFADIVFDKDAGLLRRATASFISLYELHRRDRLIMVTDTFINDSPSLSQKQDIVENALSLTDMLGINAPKVAALAAIEQINPNIPSTLDAAILSKMSQRRQFGNAVIEGPIDIDCALSRSAAARKGVDSVVTGNVDIYLVPDIEAGYSLSQLLIFIGRMAMAGVVMGTTSPVILDLPYTTRASKFVEIALAVVTCG